jgi:hypothetical protein
MIIVRNKLAGYLLTGQYHAMCIWPFLFIRQGIDLSASSSTLNHERIHARQQLEMLWLLFFIWYGLEFAVRLVQYQNRHMAYHALSFEKEAYANDENPEYLKSRKIFAWKAFL